MNKNRPGLLVAAAILTASLLLSACGGDTPTPTPTLRPAVVTTPTTAKPATTVTTPTAIKSMPAPSGTADTGGIDTMPAPVGTADMGMIPTPDDTSEPGLAAPITTPLSEGKVQLYRYRRQTVEGRIADADACVFV